MGYIKVLVTEVRDYVVRIDEESSRDINGNCYDDVIEAVESRSTEEIYYAMMSMPPLPTSGSYSVHVFAESIGLILEGKGTVD